MSYVKLDEESSSISSQEVQLPGFKPVTLRLDVAVQHTLHWTAVTKEGTTLPVLPAGSCNLYLFPRIALGRGVARKKSASNKLEDHAQEASDEDQVLLKRLLLATFETTSGSLMDQTDQSGAYPIHALMVGNTDASLALSLDLFRASPALLTRTHGKGPFEGESSLIIAIVNRREDVVLTMLELAKKLPEDRRDDFLRAQPTGPFFSDLPMLHFGGTPLGYACVFELKQAVLEMLRLGLDLNDEPCTATGFLPIHALVANSKLEMIDWVTELAEMPLKSARRVETAQVGLHATCNYHGQSALQLAASLGDHRTFKHLLMKQTSVDWVWGARHSPRHRLITASPLPPPPRRRLTAAATTAAVHRRCHHPSAQAR